jgi:hypothetical protein
VPARAVAGTFVQPLIGYNKRVKVLRTCEHCGKSFLDLLRHSSRCPSKLLASGGAAVYRSVCWSVLSPALRPERPGADAKPQRQPDPQPDSARLLRLRPRREEKRRRPRQAREVKAARTAARSSPAGGQVSSAEEEDEEEDPSEEADSADGGKARKEKGKPAELAQAHSSKEKKKVNTPPAASAAPAKPAKSAEPAKPAAPMPIAPAAPAVPALVIAPAGVPVPAEQKAAETASAKAAAEAPDKVPKAEVDQKAGEAPVPEAAAQPAAAAFAVSAAAKEQGGRGKEEEAARWERACVLARIASHLTCQPRAARAEKGGAGDAAARRFSERKRRAPSGKDLPSEGKGGPSPRARHAPPAHFCRAVTCLRCPACPASFNARPNQRRHIRLSHPGLHQGRVLMPLIIAANRTPVRCSQRWLRGVCGRDSQPASARGPLCRQLPRRARRRAREARRHRVRKLPRRT